MHKTISIIVSGKVQGVWYRKHTQEKAAEFGIKGTVENTKDENVKIIATAASSQLEQLISWCKQGPPKAIVENVTVTELPLHLFEDFKIIRHLFG